MIKEVVGTTNYVGNETVQELSPRLKAVWDEMFVCRAEMEEIFQHESFIIGNYEANYLVASYLLAKVCQYDDPFKIQFEDLNDYEIDKDIICLAHSNHINEAWSDLQQLLKKHEKNIFRLNAILQVKIIKDKNTECNVPIQDTIPEIQQNATPDGIAELAINLLDIRPEDTCAELCCRTGQVIMAIKDSYPSVTATGYELDSNAIAVAKIISELSEKEISYVKTDVFSLADMDGKIAPSYDKIFANYPFGIGLRKLNANNNYLNISASKIPSISKATSADWLYNLLMTEMLSDNGKAIGIMTNGSTSNMNDAPIRKYFVEHGLIECVIALPAKLFEHTAIATSMIIFSHGNNGVRLVDASSHFTAGRRTNNLTDDDVTAIIGMVSSDSEKSIFIDIDKLRKNDYVLNTNRYLVDSKSVKNGAAFETVIKRITRGAPLNAKQLDELSTSDVTNMRYLMLSNIQNGIIDLNLPFLTHIDRKNEKYCLKNHCLIISKNGNPYKIAVAEVKDNQNILANGNLYIIELDEKRVDPYYLAAFFSSKIGTSALKSITVGATVPNIGIEQLKKLVIPLPPLEKQKKVATRYQETRDAVMRLQLEVQRACDNMECIFEEETSQP